MPEPSPEHEVDQAPRRVPSLFSLSLESSRNVRIASLAILAIGVFTMLMYHPFIQAEGGDDAIWDYVTQCIVRGQVPYRDVIEIKTPGSAYLSAAAIFAGKTIGAPDILSIRVAYVLLVGVLCAVIFLTALAYFESSLAGLIAVLLVLMTEGLPVMMTAGTRPKVPMIIFGLLTLLLIAKEKPFWGGVCSMLSCLCWQPGLLFTATALLIFSKYMTSWRDLRALRVLLGACVPLGLMLLYFAAAGALGDFWSWTVTYNYRVYMPEGSEPPAASLARLWYLINQVTGGSTFWVKLGALGFLIYCGKRLWARRKGRIVTTPDLFKDSLVIAVVFYLAFKVVNYPGIDDLIPLFPFIGLFTGFVFTEAARVIGAVSAVRRNHSLACLGRCIPVSAAIVLAVLTIRHAIAYRVEGNTLQEQQSKVLAVADLLEPDDKIYVHGTLELLVLLNRPNLNQYILLDRGKDRYIAERIPDGFDGLIDQMRAQRPKVIAISRIQNVSHRDALLSWAAADFEKVPLEFAHNSVYVRRPDK